jgi:magnesium-transporting ATPase (P-type)
MNIILCHDVIATHKKDDARPLAYQGSSPDEITLLDAAKEVGYIFFDRTSESMFVDIFGRQK